MKFMVRRYFSCYCTHEIEADNASKAYQMTKKLPVDELEILDTLESWKDCDEVESTTND